MSRIRRTSGPVSRREVSNGKRPIRRKYSHMGGKALHNGNSGDEAPACGKLVEGKQAAGLRQRKLVGNRRCVDAAEDAGKLAADGRFSRLLFGRGEVEPLLPFGEPGEGARS